MFFVYVILIIIYESAAFLAFHVGCRSPVVPETITSIYINQTKGGLILEKDLTTLANEITYRKYLLEKVNVKKLFSEITVLNYNAMQSILRFNKKKENVTDRIYLRELSEELKIPISKVSKMISELQENGMVRWKHEGKGEQGTYIEITDRGIAAVKKQQDILKVFYGTVVTRYGTDKFVQMLDMVKELEDIMSEELENI